MPKNTNRLAIAITAVGGVAIFATTIGLVTRIRYTGENPRAELESLVSRVQNVAFKSDVFDDSTTYSQIKSQLFDQSGKLLAGTDLNKFISFYTQVNSKLRKFEPTFAPNKPFLEFIDLIPNDNDQSFELRFRAKHQIDNNHTAFSTIISKKVSFAQRSQFALAEFNSNLEKITKSFKENIQNLRRQDFSSSVINPSLTDQKIASLTRAEDFAADINKSGTEAEAIKKISQYFPDFQKLINELNFDKNNFFPFKQGTIYNFSLEKHPGTNNFISVGPNSVPSFLVKAELSDDAKFELKNFNIEDAQLLEKIDLVPQASSGSEASQGEEKQAKQPTYFADVDDILSKISLRKLQFTDFKVKADPVVVAQIQASLVASETPGITQLVQVAADLTQGQAQPQPDGASGTGQTTGGDGQQGTTGTNGTDAASTGTGGVAAAGAAAAANSGAGSTGETTESDGQTGEQQPETTPAQPEDKTKELVKYLEISTRTVNDFFASFNKKIYSSVREKSKEVVDKINSDLLINPISLDFGDFNKYFDKKQPQGVDFYLDLSKAQEKDGVNTDNSNLEIPVVINLYSSFFGDSENKLLGSKTSVFEIPNFKKVTGQTSSGTGANIESNLDTERKTFYNLDGLPTTSSQQETAVTVSTAASGTATNTNKQVRIGSTTAYISKTELENLIGTSQTSGGSDQTTESKAPKFEEIKKIIGNPFQYAYDFDANESMLKAWVGQQKFPKLEDFASFTENNFIASDYKIKSLKSDKFFKNEYDVASFYAYLIQMEPAQVLNYLFEIAKANGLVDKNASINLNDIKDDNIFKIASDVKFKTTDKVYSLDFNNQFLGFDSRGWISNLFLPKSVWDKTKTLINDSDIFKQLNQYSPVKVEENSASGSGGATANSGTDELYKQLQEAAKKIKDELKKQSSSILKAGATDSSSGGGSGSTSPSSIQAEIKKFFEEKTQPLSTLKDLLLAFYYKAKELTNFNAWSKLGSDLDYKIIFEKQSTSTSSGGSTSSGSGETLTTPSGLEDYKLTYYYKVFDKNTGVDKYQTPKIDLSLWVNTQDTQRTERDELNKAVLSIPPSFSLFYLKKEDFDKLKKDDSTQSKFEETTVFKEIQAKIQENNKDLKLSVVSIDEDKISPQKFKVVNLQIEKTTPTTAEGSATGQSVKSSLSFQVRIALDDTQN
ncbi:P97 family adhesin [Mesomycoplasma ovipneumoniae]|uniref:P97 family adhesin n=1 Tax=Mesomycoplasma ovipneumoniae TaxID=29562 RepID=UPI002079D4F9|nr:adhesin [Mesomycoplasma ovipneumoniae]MCN0158343.1 adhesin [Mesomycoplasma ovipneumoniae]